MRPLSLTPPSLSLPTYLPTSPTLGEEEVLPISPTHQQEPLQEERSPSPESVCERAPEQKKLKKEAKAASQTSSTGAAAKTPKKQAAEPVAPNLACQTASEAAMSAI